MSGSCDHLSFVPRRLKPGRSRDPIRRPIGDPPRGMPPATDFGVPREAREAAEHESPMICRGDRYGRP